MSMLVVILLVIVTIALLMIGIGLVLSHNTSKAVVIELTKLHQLINSRMSDWVKAEKSTSHFEGHKEGVEQERVDERSRRADIIAEADQSKAGI